jgi:hypothetical protein
MAVATNGSPLLGAADYSVKVDEKPTVLVAIKDFPSPGELSFVGILQDAIKCVANIIPRFDTFF